MHRSAQEIDEAILKLERNLVHCTPYCCFGNDNKKKIAIMIDVIKNGRLKVWINSVYLTPSELLHQHPDNVFWQTAIDALDWLNGDFAFEDLLFEEVSAGKKFSQNIQLNN